MEKKTVFQKEDTNKNTLIQEKKIEVKNNSINGSGSESILDSIHSDKKEIEPSTSSVELMPLSNNSINISINISNENKNPNNNEQNSSINNSDNPNSIVHNNSLYSSENPNNNKQNNSVNNSDNPDNNNEKNLMESDLSRIKNISLVGSKNELNDIIYIMKEDKDKDIINNSDYEKKIDNLLDSILSQNNNEKQNEQTHSSNDISINNNSQNKNHKNNESNNSKKSNRLNEENKLEVKKKIKEGYIPFFIQVKGYQPQFYYGKPDFQIKIGIEVYIKKMNIPKTKKLSFYYDNNLIDINKTIGELGILKLRLIEGEIL